MSASLDERAREALRLVDANPAESASLARAVVRQARQDHELAPMSLAEQVLGMTALQLEDPDAAMRHLRVAVRLARRAGSPELLGEAQMRLAFVLNVRGRWVQALREIETALSCLTGVRRARAQAQRGTILLQRDRLDEALADYQAALSVLRRAGDHLWVERVLYNRAVLHGYRQDFAAAEADLQEAALLCSELELDLMLGFVHENLGWISGLRGDVPAALHHLDLAEERLRAHGAPVGELLTDRCQLLLSVRLLSEAMQAAEEAVTEFEQQRRNCSCPRRGCGWRRSPSWTGRPVSGCGRPAPRCASSAARDGRAGRRLAVSPCCRRRLAAARHAGALAGVSVRSVEQVADDLAGANWPLAALEARLLAGRLAAERGSASRAQAQFQQAARQRDRDPALHRAQAWYAEAQRRLANGDHRGATAAARTALRVMDEHRAGLGATDLRAHASGHRVEVAEFGLRMAFDSGQPARVLEWAEQGRASHLTLRPGPAAERSRPRRRTVGIAGDRQRNLQAPGRGWQDHRAGAAAGDAGAADPRLPPPASRRRRPQGPPGGCRYAGSANRSAMPSCSSSSSSTARCTPSSWPTAGPGSASSALRRRSMS